MALQNKQPIKMATDEEWAADLWHNQNTNREIPDILADIDFFDGFTREELEQIANIMHTRSYMPKEVIVRQGVPGAGMYVILSGSADVFLETADNKTIPLATLGDQQFFGEMSLLDGASRAASVIASERTETLGFFRPDLMGLIERSPRLGFKIVWQVTQIMGARLRETLREFRTVMHTLRALEDEAAMKASTHKG